MPEKRTEVKDLPDRGTKTGVSDNHGCDLSEGATNKEGSAKGAQPESCNPGCADE